MIKYELKPGEITLEYTADVHILEAITHLKKDGLIFPKKTIHAWGFLNTQPFIPDMLLCYEKVVLPRIYWYDLEHETLISELDELVDKKILYVPPDSLFNRIECLQLEEEFSSSFGGDPRYITITYLANPGRFKNELRQLGINVPKNFRNPWLGGAGEVASWLSSIDPKEVFDKVKQKVSQRRFSGSSICQSIVSKCPVVAEGYLGPVNLIYARFMGESSRQGSILFLEILKKRGEVETDVYNLLFNEVKRARDKITSSLEENDIVTKTVDFPLSLPLILREIEDGKGPKQFYDKIMELRKEYRPLRKWLTEFDAAIKDGKIKEIIKYKRELNKVVNKFLESHEIHKKYTSNQNISHFSELSAIAAQAGLAIHEPTKITSTILSNPLIKKALERIFEPVNYKLNPHRLHLKDIAELSLVSWKELRKELIRCFPEQGEEFAQTLLYYSEVSRICREILTMDK